jgi:hypothetical protein
MFLFRFSSPFLLALCIGGLSPSATLTASIHGDYVLKQVASISAKGYPAGIQEIYTLYEAKCTTCHGEKEIVKSTGVLPTYWEQTVERMRVMPKAEFSSDEGQRIADFLIYDSFERRRLELKNQLKALSPEQLKVEQEKLDAVINKYKH